MSDFSGYTGPASGQPAAGSSSNNFSDSSQVLIAHPGTQTSTDHEMGSHFSSTYQTPAHTESVSTQMRWFYSLRGPDLTHLQDQLESAGLLAKGKYGRGISGDEDTAKAYETLLGRAFYTQQTIDETLANSTAGVSAMGGAAGAAGPTKQPLVLQLTNPEDIKKAVKDQAQNTIGRKLTDAEANAFVSLYQGMEKSYQQGVYGATGSGLPGGTGGTFEQPPSLSSFTEDQIRQRYPAEAGAHDIANAGSEFFSMLNGGIK